MDRTILIVDDVRSNREILKKILGSEYNTLEACDGREALGVMRRDIDAISAVILDLGMPVMDGFEVLEYMRSDVTLKQLPVIVTTGLTDSDSEERALNLGAKDYISKPYKSAIIRQRIRNTINLRETAAAVNALSRDALTGLYSRAAFFETAREMIAAHEAGYYIMACFDIGKFKVVNDQYGTKRGDEVLCHVARAFSEGFEAHGGICCRVSGDDFAVLYPTSFRDSEEIAQIRKIACQVDWLASPLVFSVGRYLADDKTLSPSAMYDRAIIAADSIKGRYDTQIAVYDKSMRDRLIYEQEIVNEMESALKAGQFETWFQPQYNHTTKALIGSEALVRWRHPEKGLIPPCRFVPVFEQNGFIYELDKFVWESSCRLLRKWLDEGLSPVPVSVNISRYDVFRPDIIDVITALVEKYNISADMLRLEITESAFAENTELIVSVVKRLINNGFTLEIDDFGSGYSSFNTLKSVPAQVLKLDMRFLEDGDDSKRGGNIIESIVRMTKWLGMSVIAEGVEKIEQADYLKSIGCNYIQGYLYSKPVQASEYEKYLRGADKEEKLLTLHTVENLDNNSFWNPKSMDTLIFNSYVGAACIFEYHRGRIELLRATEKYAQVIGSAGMTVDDALRLDWSDHLDEENGEKVINALETSLETRSEVTCEYVFLDLPNCPHETHLRSTMRVIATAGNRYLVYCTNENITAQRKAERRERVLVRQLRAVLDNVNCGVTAVTVKDDTVEYLLTNSKYYELLGYTKRQYEAEVGGKAFTTIHPEDRTRVADMVSRVMSTGIPASLEYRAIKRDGGFTWLRSNISMTEFEGVEEAVQLSTYVNITSEKHIRQRERRATEQFEAILADIGIGITAAVRENGVLRFLFSNDRFYELHGYTRERYAKEIRDVFDLVYPEDLPRLRDAISAAREHGTPVRVEYRITHADGTERSLRAFYSSTRFTGVAEKVVLCTVTDITAEKRFERELLDNMPHGEALYSYENGKLSVVHLNKRYWELVNRPSVEYSQASFMDALHPGDRQSALNELNSAISEKRDLNCEVRIRCGEDGYKAFRISGRIVPKGEGAYSIYASYTPVLDEASNIREMLPVALKAMMDSQTGFSFVKDKSLKYVCCSRAVWEAAGFDDENDIIGKTDYELLGKSEADVYFSTDTQVLESGESLIDRMDSIPDSAGGLRYTLTSKYPLKDSRGDIIGVYGSGRDITESRRLREHYELLTSAVPGGIAVFDCPTDDPGGIRLQYFSDGFCGLFGFERKEYEEFCKINPYGTSLEQGLEDIREQVRTVIEKKTAVDFVYRAWVKGGGTRWINAKAAPGEAYGTSMTINAVAFDVTDQQKALDKLRVSEEENRLAIEHSGCIICRYTIADRTARLLPEVAAAFNIPIEVSDVPDKPVREGLISPDTAGVYTAFYNKIIAGEKSGEAVYKERFRDSWRWMRARFSTIFSSSGKPISAVISFFDVTLEQEKEAVYKKWQQSLTDKDPGSYTLFRCNLSKNASFDTVEGTLLNIRFEEGSSSFNERTREYVSARVFEDDKQEYLAFMNSDTLLANYYRGKRSQTLEYREKPEVGDIRWLKLTVDLIEYPNSTDVEAYLMYENINDSKLSEIQTREMAQTDPLTGILNRAAFIERCTKLMSASAPGDHHALLMLDIDGFKLVNDVFGHGAGDKTLIDIASSLSSVMRRDDLVGRLGGDEFLVFLKSIPSDAVAAMKARQIGALARKAYSMEVQISASIGIAAAPRDGCDFETLYKKADSALYYVKGSGKDNYAFYRDDMHDEHLEPEKDSNEPERNAQKKRRMLIVDDSMIDHEILTNIFKDEFIIEKAKDGNSALIRLRHYTHAISVVLLDLMMPGMDGFAVLEKMRTSAELRSIPVIVVTGDDKRETCLDTIRSGATDFIPKPVDPELLRIRVHSAISKAENERLRAQNSFLEYQNAVITRYKTVLDRLKTVIVEQDWITGSFVYDQSMSEAIAGVFDNRGLWKIFADDKVTDAETAERMRAAVDKVARDDKTGETAETATLRTAQNENHLFKMRVYKTLNEFGKTGKVYITFEDKGKLKDD